MSQMWSRISAGLVELRRRKVIRTGALYIVGAWLVLQVADVAFPAFGIPDVALRYVVFAAVLGFPIALVFGWMFQITPHGLVRTTPLAAAEMAEVDVGLRKSDYVIITALVAVMGAIIYGSLLKVAETPISELAGEIPENSIAVLPFVNMSADQDNEYFSDGISEELLDRLAKLEGLHVAARTSSFYFKGKDIGIQAIGERLGVRNVLEGSVRRAGDAVRITAQLIDADTGYHLWSDTYDRELRDIFAVQDDIATNIVAALQLQLGADEPAVQAWQPTTDLEAYQLFLQGQFQLQRRGESALRRSIELFQEALDRDPEFAKVHASLATAHALLPEYSGEPADRAYAMAETFARRAIDLDADLGGPHAVLAYMHMRRWEWPDSGTAYVRALGLQPNHATTHQWYSNFLNDVAYRPQGLAEAQRAYALDPVSPAVNIVLAINYVWAGEAYGDEALEHITAARELGYGGLLDDVLEFIVRLRLGQHEAAAGLLEGAYERSGKSAAWIRPLVDGMADRGRRLDAIRALAAARERGELTERDLFLRYLLLDEPDPAFAVAERHLDDASLPHAWFLLPEAARFRADPRFRTLVERMGLADYWHEYGWPEICEPTAESFVCR